LGTLAKQNFFFFEPFLRKGLCLSREQPQSKNIFFYHLSTFLFIICEKFKTDLKYILQIMKRKLSTVERFKYYF